MSLFKPLLTFILAFMVSFSVVAANKVLVIESYHSEYQWDQSYLKGIRDTLGDGYQVLTFQMDTKRIPKSEYQAMADKAWAYYQETQPDVVILGDDNALKFLGKRLNDAGTPTVFLGINSNPRSLGVQDMENVTGVLERPLFKRNIADLNKVMGGKLRSILVLFDSGNTSKAAVDEAFKGKDSLKVGKVQAKLQLIGEQDRWQQVVKDAKAAGHQAIIVGLYHTIVDGSGKHIPANDVLAWTSQNTPVPAFAFWDFAVGKGKGVGGLVIFGEEQGMLAAKMVKKITSGQKPSAIRPVIAKKGRFYFSQAELDKWQLTLPAAIQGKASIID